MWEVCVYVNNSWCIEKGPWQWTVVSYNIMKNSLCCSGSSKVHTDFGAFTNLSISTSLSHYILTTLIFTDVFYLPYS